MAEQNEQSKEIQGKASIVRFENLVLNPSIPKIYANGFSVGLTAADAHIVFLLNNIPVGTLNLSMTAAKSLNNVISEMVSKFESKTGEILKDSREYQKLLINI